MQITEHGRAFVQSKEYKFTIKALAALNMDDEMIYVYTAVSLCMGSHRQVVLDEEAIATFINDHKQEIQSVANAALHNGRVKKQNPNSGLWQDYVPLL